MNDHHNSVTPTILRQAMAPIAALLLALVTLLAVGAPAQADAPASDRQTARYEVRFMTSMIDHHAMAIEMSQICLDKADHAELKDMCAQIIAAQQSEIDTMQGWLADWYGVDHEPTMTTGDMRSMKRLERLDGADFEIAFMKSMTRHHWKAVTEANKCVDTADHDQLVSMCQDIIAAQLAEIDQMRTWLCEWYDRCGGRPTETA